MDDPSILLHNDLVSSASKDCAICFTDGSASPNPGPFLQDPDIVIDAGVSLGYGTNNIGELAALILCLRELMSLSCRRNITRAIIFSDSKYAINHATGKKAPKINAVLVKCLRSCYVEISSKLDVTLVWVRGHTLCGGNIRVDLVSKHFASSNTPDPVHFDHDMLNSMTRKSSAWPYGFPLNNVPLCFFSPSYVPIF